LRKYERPTLWRVEDLQLAAAGMAADCGVFMPMSKTEAFIWRVRGLEGHGLTEEDVELAERTINSHEALVEALVAVAEEALKGMSYQTQERMRAALALAKGESK
jgi:hypothetical protein